MGDVTCKACGDTGRNSKGGVCIPCQRTGRLAAASGASDTVVAKVAEAVAAVLEGCAVPSKEELVRAVEWACKPKVVYVAAYRDTHGGLGVFAGPTENVNELRKVVPPKLEGPPPYIVRMTKTTFGSEPTMEPVARWRDGRWQRKRKPQGDKT